MSAAMKIVVGMLVVSFIASLYTMWVVLYRLRSHLISTSYKFIFAGKVCFALLTGSGIYLVIWPLPVRIVLVQLTWFATLATATICSAIGFHMYSRDVRAVLESNSYTEPLPAIPPTAQEGLHISSEAQTRRIGDVDNSTRGK